jgi:hypothetical protein
VIDSLVEDASAVEAALAGAADGLTVPEIKAATGIGETRTRHALIYLLGGQRVRGEARTGRVKSKTGRTTAGSAFVWMAVPRGWSETLDWGDVIRTMAIRARRCREMSEAHERACSHGEAARCHGKAVAYEHAAELVQDAVERGRKP